MRRTLILFVLAIICAAGMLGQVQPVDSASAADTVSLLDCTSDPSGAAVYLDSVRIGVTPLEGYRITPGSHLLTLTHPDSRNWMRQAVSETLVVGRNGKIGKSIKFPRLVIVTSEPGGAEVGEGDSVIGTTPCVIQRDAGRSARLFIRKEGYATRDLSWPMAEGEFHCIMEKNQLAAGGEDLKLNGKGSRSNWTEIITTGTAVLTGAISAWTKIKADKYYDDYRRSGDPALLDKIHQYDRVAGISFAVCQINLIILSYSLLSR
jgi:hypothetical protein